MSADCKHAWTQPLGEVRDAYRCTRCGCAGYRGLDRESRNVRVQPYRCSAVRDHAVCGLPASTRVPSGSWRCAAHPPLVKLEPRTGGSCWRTGCKRAPTAGFGVHAACDEHTREAMVRA